MTGAAIEPPVPVLELPAPVVPRVPVWPAVVDPVVMPPADVAPVPAAPVPVVVPVGPVPVVAPGAWASATEVANAKAAVSSALRIIRTLLVYVRATRRTEGHQRLAARTLAGGDLNL